MLHRQACHVIDLDIQLAGVYEMDVFTKISLEKAFPNRDIVLDTAILPLSHAQITPIKLIAS